MSHSIELSTAVVRALRKLFDNLTESDLENTGFNARDIESLGELYRGVKGVCENLEIIEESHD